MPGESRLVTITLDHSERGDPRPLSPTVHVEKIGTEEQALGGAPLVLMVWGHWWGSGGRYVLALALPDRQPPLCCCSGQPAGDIAVPAPKGNSQRNRPPVSSGPVLATHGDLNVNQLKLTFK